MQFTYKAIKSTGEIFEGSEDAMSKTALYQTLKKEGITLISASEQTAKGAFSFNLKNWNPLLRVGMSEKIMFAKNLGRMIGAGLPMARAISVLERQSRNAKFKEILKNIGNAIGKGESLSQALSKYPRIFSNLLVSMVKAGEESGTITKALSSIASQMEKSYLLQKKIRGAMIYPAVIISVMIIIGILMFVYVVPTLTNTFKELNVKLPFSTRIVVFASDFLQNNFAISLLALFFIVAGLIVMSRTAKGKRALDFISLHTPIISQIVKDNNAARTARTLSSLLSSGVDYLVSIRITSDVVQNGYYKEVLKKAEKNVEKGEPISTVFLSEERLFPAFVGEMASIGEETGKLSEMFLNVAEFYENEVDQKTKDMSTVIEPFLMILIGAAVGFFAISMLSPIYSLVDTI